MPRVSDIPLTLIWYRDDLRVGDHPGLHAAARRGDAVLPVFTWDPAGRWPGGAAARHRLGSGLRALHKSLKSLGLPLVVRSGPPETVLPELAAASGARRVTWARGRTPDQTASDARVEDALRAIGAEPALTADGLLHLPEAVQTTSGTPYRTFTPFHNRLLAISDVPRPLPAPEPGSVHVPSVVPDSSPIDLVLAIGSTEPANGASPGSAGEDAAHERLASFALGGLEGYPELRDRPDLDGTSRLSAYFRFGEITPAQVLHHLQTASAGGPAFEAFRRQLHWREFAYHLLHHFPRMVDTALDPAFRAFPWRVDDEALAAWKEGRTGYPVVDAGMRALAATGWMHNRLRMVVASFLTKHLLVPWQEGAAWFMKTLLDGDPALNSLGWQWVAGCGADAQPFFRVFNPVLQGRRFDPAGLFVRTWLPELAELPARYVHAPWTAPARALAEHGVRLGSDYPHPVVDHAEARRRALEAYAVMRGRRPNT